MDVDFAFVAIICGTQSVLAISVVLSAGCRLSFLLVCHRCCFQGNINVLMVRRVNYKRRPQHDGNLETRLGNEEAITKALQEWAARTPGVFPAPAAVCASLALPTRSL